VECITVQQSRVHSESTVQYSTVQYSSTVQCSTVQYSTVQHSKVQCSVVQYSTVQYSTIHSSTLKHSTIKCSREQCNKIEEKYSTEYRRRKAKNRIYLLMTAIADIEVRNPCFFLGNSSTTSSTSTFVRKDVSLTSEDYLRR
jgi:hypothetical protein